MTSPDQRRSPSRASNRIRELRKKRGVSAEELAAALGVTTTHLYRIEMGDRRLSADWMAKIAETLNCNVYELLTETSPQPRTVSVSVAAEQRDRVLPVEKPKTVTLPSRADNLAGVSVDSDDYWPRYEQGDVLLYAPSDGVDDRCLGRECIVCTKAGALYVKRLRRGATAGTYRLLSSRMPDMDDVALEWAAPILWIRRKDAERSE